jgi:hypothetical protein
LFATDAVLFEQWTNLAHERAGEIRHAPAIGMFDAAEQTDREGADYFVKKSLERSIVHYA